MLFMRIFGATDGYRDNPGIKVIGAECLVGSVDWTALYIAVFT